jgi:hypothetical protein
MLGAHHMISISTLDVSVLRTPVTFTPFDWQHAYVLFGELSFDIISRPLRSPVPEGLSTGTPYCAIQILLYRLIYITCYTYNIFRFLFYYLPCTSQRGDVVIRLPELRYVA